MRQLNNKPNPRGPSTQTVRELFLNKYLVQIGIRDKVLDNKQNTAKQQTRKLLMIKHRRKKNGDNLPRDSKIATNGFSYISGN